MHVEQYRRIVAAKMFIDENYSQPIKLEDISGNACFSPFHFHRLFRNVYKITPHRYLTGKRMDKARLLLQANKTVADVCNEVGFESIGSFSMLFKKEIGFAPQVYRDLFLQKKREQEAEPAKAIPHCFLRATGQ
ncbi:MAG: helix-turn-helix transcriptional regulator [Chitinophagaceae bacterium]|nr:helix-turn-helix transcriptional regulator [Chitinophagaceae bacterium]MBL0334438.1 helix-turn-helix transcriptional regulator [Chitinophagaceae bacterium]